MKRYLSLTLAMSLAGAAAASAQQAQTTQAPAVQAPAGKAQAPAKAQAKHKAEGKQMTQSAPKFSADQIKDVQTALQKAGYYKGAVDGTWNAAGRAGLRKYQKANKMPANGKLTPELVEKLKSGSM
jgi:peptidoglycan hydrolase-like protein with peptidoglycan-binding domain